MNTNDLNQIKNLNDDPLIGSSILRLVGPESTSTFDYEAVILWVDRFKDKVWAVWVLDGNEATPFSIDYPLDFKTWKVPTQ